MGWIPLYGFNGAALIRARKSKLEGFADAKISASTGPRSFERGNRPGTKKGNKYDHRFNGAALIRARKSTQVQE